LGRKQDLVLDQLSLDVRSLQQFRGSLGILAIVGEKELKRTGSRLHPPCSIDSRAKPPSEVSSREPRCIHARRLQQRPQPGIGRNCHRPEPVCHERAVTSPQWHHIRHGGKSCQLESGRWLTIGSGKFEQSLNDHASKRRCTDRHSRRTEHLRVNDQGLRKSTVGSDPMVVDYQYLHTSRASMRDLVDRCDAAVNCNQDLAAGTGEVVDCSIRQSIAGRAFWHARDGLDPELAQTESEDGRRTDTVAVVIAMNADYLARIHAPQEPLGRLLNLPELFPLKSL
jgi:hypothetical protein